MNKPPPPKDPGRRPQRGFKSPRAESVDSIWENKKTAAKSAKTGHFKVDPSRKRRKK